MPLPDKEQSDNDAAVPSDLIVPSQPLESKPATDTFGDDRAGVLVRRKIAAILAEETSPGERLEPITTPGAEPSRHEQFLYGLLNSNRSLAETVGAWRDYYAGLPESGKREVWQEFYAPAQSLPLIKQPLPVQPEAVATDSSAPTVPSVPAEVLTPPEDDLTYTAADQTLIAPGLTALSDESSLPSEQTSTPEILDTPPEQNGFFSGRRQLRAIATGLGFGLLVAFISLFTFFNQQFIAPFIQPAKRTTQVPVIIGDTASEVDPSPKVVIPKINVEIPVDYSLTTDEESSVETALEGGVVHYPSTVLPGQAGNAAFFGHSSNNIFNPGKYKFAFVLLHELEIKDIFYLNYKGTLYAYEVISSQIVSPSDVAVLGPVSGQTATATLITCDPPGTSINRLIVVGKQISPDPSGNTAPAVPTPVVASTSTAAKLPGNPESLYQRIRQKFF
jgi:LPXTG-site transpeptidase (sortase) family protein